MSFPGYSGAGNDFVMVDARSSVGDVSALRSPDSIRSLCLSYGGARPCADGIIFLCDSAGFDFRMEFYNPDGSSGMMCGNGGRCVAVFARDLGVRPSGSGGVFRFEAPDGVHSAEISSCACGDVVRLSMKDVTCCARVDVPFRGCGCRGVGCADPTTSWSPHSCAVGGTSPASTPPEGHPVPSVAVHSHSCAVGGTSPASTPPEGHPAPSVAVHSHSCEMTEGWFLDTGARHLVVFVPDVEDVDVEAEGRRLRHSPEFAPEGANVDFVSVLDGGLAVRTFEKGVEGETLACGTGITASAIASYFCGLDPSSVCSDGRVRFDVRARAASLSVDFLPSSEGVSSVFLTGPVCRL